MNLRLLEGLRSREMVFQNVDIIAKSQEKHQETSIEITTIALVF
jgi:hypothetical protein